MPLGMINFTTNFAKMSIIIPFASHLVVRSEEGYVTMCDRTAKLNRYWNSDSNLLQKRNKCF